jgi:heme/copper-type cytochrome/quinol oxidase subunit 2
MQITVVVDEPAEYEAWLTKQKTFGGAATVAPAAEPAPATSPADTSNTGAAQATALNN